VRSLSSNNSGRRACAALSHPDPKTDGFANQLQRRAESEGPDNRFNPKTQQRSLDALQWGSWSQGADSCNPSDVTAQQAAAAAAGRTRCTERHPP